MKPRHMLSIMAALMILSGCGPIAIPIWLFVTGWMLCQV